MVYIPSEVEYVQHAFRDHPRCGTPEQIHTDIKKAITNYRDTLVKRYTTFYANTIHFKLTELCLHEDFWVTDLLGGPNPLPKPPIVDRNDPSLSRAYLCGFNKDLDRQMLRYEDTLVSNTYAKFNIIFTNLQLALEAIVDSYNDIIALLGMSFSRIIDEFYPRSVHHIVPQLTRSQRYYIPLSGPTGYIAWAATHLARIKKTQSSQRTINQQTPGDLYPGSVLQGTKKFGTNQL